MAGSKSRAKIVEPAIRPQTVKRKSSLFAGSEATDGSGYSLATLLQTYKMSGVIPLEWLSQREHSPSQTPSRIAQGWPVIEIEGLNALELQI